MHIIKFYCFTLFFLFGILDRAFGQQLDTAITLKESYRDYFPIGVAVSPNDINFSSQRISNLIIKQFNSLTPENAMKMGPIHPEEDRYNWKNADAVVNFAQKNHMRIRGHNLCWHNQAPKWIFYDKSGNVVSKEVLLNRLKEHIQHVVGRYKGRIYAWDVVNEAVSDDSTQFLRNSMWYKICGEDFIYKAFQFAHEADPDAQLFYNDYNTERPGKRERLYKLLKQMIDAKIPINGVGLQAHWSIFEPSRHELEETIERFASLGLKIQITELDMSVYPWEKNNRKKEPGERELYTKEAAERQSEQYEMVFQVFRKYRDVITGVTFWNVSDAKSWLNDFPVRGRKNYPLLFDRELQPKPAFWRVVKF
ncbi:endo-1,4-beta-xylanase [Mucilaginibacter sp.]|uniref:endo-1,4-beta-xylanase n=1 Tax=Mucilaginibacter sp. TaxID=1882438 RepID=UPI002ED4AD56